MKRLLFITILCIFVLAGCSDTEEVNNDKVETTTEKISTDNVVDIISNEDTETEAEVASEQENSVQGDNKNEQNDELFIGKEVEVGGVKFYVYKIDGEDIYLLAKENVAKTCFSDNEHQGSYVHSYEGSLVEDYVNYFVHDLEDKGAVIKSSGIIDKDDLYDLGFKHSDGLSGRPYSYEYVYDFVDYQDTYWVGGYCKYDTYSWVYSYGLLDTQKCSDEYGVRPIIVVDDSEIGKKDISSSNKLSIYDIVGDNSVWLSDGGLANPYDKYYFDCDNMKFIFTFESSELSEKLVFNMEFSDDNTIRIDGVHSMNKYPAKLIIVDENTLRVRFLDDSYNTSDNFLIKSKE